MDKKSQGEVMSESGSLSHHLSDCGKFVMIHQNIVLDSGFRKSAGAIEIDKSKIDEIIEMLRKAKG